MCANRREPAKGVRVNAIAPGPIQTVLSEYYWKHESRLAERLEKTLIKHFVQPEEIAGIALVGVLSKYRD